MATAFTAVELNVLSSLAFHSKYSGEKVVTLHTLARLSTLLNQRICVLPMEKLVKLGYAAHTTRGFTKYYFITKTGLEAHETQPKWFMVD
jgi:hypothetical protein